MKICMHSFIHNKRIERKRLTQHNLWNTHSNFDFSEQKAGSILTHKMSVFRNKLQFRNDSKQ